MNNVKIFGIPFLKKGSGIHIKEKNKGSFTKYCNGKVTQECIDKAKKSPNKAIRKKAIFALNSRSWSKKHSLGGIIRKWKHQNGGSIGGYDSSTLARRKKDLHRWTPAGGLYDPFQLIFNNASSGEENEYFKTFLGFPSAVPPMSKGAETEWDAKIEAEKKKNEEPLSEFYGTTPRMDHHLQVEADTLNLGKIVRGEMPLPKDVTIKTVSKMYEQAKKVMNNPGKWQLMKDYTVLDNPEVYETLENNPLGMLNNHGMKWVPEKLKLFIHDTYNFPDWVHNLGFLLKRPKEMKIRSAISFDPKKGSIILRNKDYKFPDIKTSHVE